MRCHSVSLRSNTTAANSTAPLLGAAMLTKGARRRRGTSAAGCGTYFFFAGPSAGLAFAAAPAPPFAAALLSTFTLPAFSAFAGFAAPPAPPEVGAPAPLAGAATALLALLAELMPLVAACNAYKLAVDPRSSRAGSEAILKWNGVATNFRAVNRNNAARNNELRATASIQLRS